MNYKEAVALFLEGASVAELSKASGSNYRDTRFKLRQGCAYLMYKAGNLTAHQYREICPILLREEMAVLCAMYSSGIELERIGAKFGLDPTRVSELARSNGAAPRIVAWPHGNQTVIDTLLGAYSAGASVATLATRFGKSSETVRKVLVANGAEMRKPARPRAVSDDKGPVLPAKPDDTNKTPAQRISASMLRIKL